MVSDDLLVLCLSAFAAGFIDSIVGGGGMIQLPALLLTLPSHPVVSLLATNKLVSVTGTAVSAYRYGRHMPYIRRIILPAILCAFISSFLGAWVVSLVKSELLRPLFLVLLFLVFLTTIRGQHFGTVDHLSQTEVPLWKPMAIGSILGFYDGFFGPGTGSFLILAFVGLLSMTFVQGSAYAKVVNLTTNLAALLLFAFRTEFQFQYAIPMILFNVGGALLGVRLALLKGNDFVRGLLRAVVFATILKLGFDVVRDYLF